MTSKIRFMIISIREWIGRFVRWEPPPAVRRVALALAALIFVAATAGALRALPPLDPDPRWLVLAGVLALFVPVVNAAEYMLAGRWLGVRVGTRRALGVTVMAAVANLAPLPGAVVVRGKALLEEGTGAGETARVLGVIGAGWVTVALIVAGGGVAVGGRPASGALLLALGMAGLAFVPLLLPDESRTRGNVVVLILLELAGVTLQALRLAVILIGLGYQGRFLQTLVLPAAGALGNAAGVVPGGLGLRELLAGALAPLTEMTVAEGITATATERVLNLVVLAFAALTVVMTRGKAESWPDRDAADT